MKNPFTCSTSPSSVSALSPDEPVPIRPDRFGCDQQSSESRAVMAYLQNSMARDLHDSFPQEFQAVLMHLRVALETKSCVDAKHHVEQAIAAAQTGLTCVRALIKDLRQSSTGKPHPAAARSVMEVVSQAAHGALNTHAVEFELNHNDSEVALRSSTALHVAMIVRESIHNALKHGSPSKIWCHILASNESLVIELRDNGRGFVKQVKSGFGLIGMQERAHAIGASLRILSGQMQGCSVRLSIPASAMVGYGQASDAQLSVKSAAPARQQASLPFSALRGMQSSPPTRSAPAQQMPELETSSRFDEMEHAVR